MTRLTLKMKLISITVLQLKSDTQNFSINKQSEGGGKTAQKVRIL